MARLWNIDSPFFRKMTTLTNLVLLNILWLICCIPVITIGASTSAMYSVLFAYRRNETDNVFKPFFSAFLRCFRQATVLWLGILLIGAVLYVDFLYFLNYSPNFGWHQLPFVLVAFLALLSASYGFPQIALFDNKLRAILKNGFHLFILNFLPSIAIMMLNVFPLALLLFAPQYFLWTLLLWTLLGFSLCAYISSYLLIKIFQKYMPSEQ